MRPETLPRGMYGCFSRAGSPFPAPRETADSPVFNAAGVIALQSPLTLQGQARVTVAGQTAPGKGICIRQAPFGMSGVEDVIFSHLRLRLGGGPTYEGMGMAGADHTILDLCFVSWTIDYAFSSRGAHIVILQRTLISEPLNVAGHKNYPEGTAQGFAANIGGDVGTYHHNRIPAFMAAPHYFTVTGTDLSIDLPALFRGYTQSPSYFVSTVTGGTAVVQGFAVIFSATTCGLASVTLQVRDAEGDGMTRTICVFVDTVPGGGCVL